MTLKLNEFSVTDLKLNEFPSATYNGLNLMLSLREELTAMGRERYSEKELRSILKYSVIERMVQEQRELNRMLECTLYQVCMEHFFPLWMSEHSGKLSYTLKIEGRDMSLIDDDDFHGGHKGVKKHITYIDKDSCTKNYSEFIFSDKRIDAGDIAHYIPKDFDYMTAVIHCLKAVEKDFDRPKKIKNKKNNEENGFPDGYNIASNGLRFDLRNKSGAESIFKIVDWLRSRRDSIVDVASGRGICNQEDYIRKVVDMFESIASMYKGRGRRGAMIIQSLDPDLKKTKKAFLQEIPRKFHREYSEIVSVEYRKLPLKNRKGLPNFYVELLIPVGTRREEVSNNNPINFLLYPGNLFKAIDEQGLDPLSHKKRREDTRFETYDYQDFDTCARLLPILEGQERGYVEDIMGYRRKK